MTSPASSWASTERPDADDTLHCVHWRVGALARAGAFAGRPEGLPSPRGSLSPSFCPLVQMSYVSTWLGTGPTCSRAKALSPCCRRFLTKTPRVLGEQLARAPFLTDQSQRNTNTTIGSQDVLEGGWRGTHTPRRTSHKKYIVYMYILSSFLVSKPKRTACVMRQCSCCHLSDTHLSHHLGYAGASRILLRHA